MTESIALDRYRARLYAGMTALMLKDMQSKTYVNRVEIIKTMIDDALPAAAFVSSLQQHRVILV